MKNLKFTLIAWPVVTLVTSGLCSLTTLVAEWSGHPLPPQTSLSIILNARGMLLFKNIVLVTIAAPIFEELIFRGLLYRVPLALVSRFKYAPAVCAILSAGLFTAAHYAQMPWPDNAFLALFFFGLVQCGLYRRVGGWLGIWSPMLVHALFNTTQLILLFLFPELAGV